MIEIKGCSICNEVFPSTTEYFYKNKNSKDGLTSRCRECQKKESNKWWNINKEENLEKKRQHYEENKEDYLVKRQIHYQENKDQRLLYMREWQQGNKDKLRKYRVYRVMNKNHDIAEEEWNHCKEYFDNECAYCGLHISEHFNRFKDEMRWTDLHREHVDDSGANDLSNCIPSCKSCNSSKNTKEFEHWYDENNPNYTEERLFKIKKWLNEDYKKYIAKDKLST